MISKLLAWFKQPELDIDDFSEAYEDLQVELDNTKYAVKVLQDALNLKEKEYENLLSKYVELKVRKDVGS